MFNPVNKVILGLVSAMALCTALFLILKKYEPPKKEILAISKVADNLTHKKVKKNYRKDGSLESEELDEFVHAKLSESIVAVKETPADKNYLLGVTIGYDFDNTKYQYNLILGKAILTDLYAIAKINTDLSKAEAGIIWVH